MVNIKYFLFFFCCGRDGVGGGGGGGGGWQFFKINVLAVKNLKINVMAWVHR